MIIPYGVTCILVMLSAIFWNQILQQGQRIKGIVRYWGLAALYGAGDNYSKPFTIYGIGAIWFLLALFWGSLLLHYILKIRGEFRIFLIAFIFIVCNKTRLEMFWFPLSIQCSGVTLLFMYLGYLARELIPNIKTVSSEMKVSFFFIAFCFWLEFITHFKSFWLVHGDYGRGIFDIFESVCACCCVMLIARYIEKYTGLFSKLLAYLGKYSLLMLCMHLVELNTFPWNLLITKILPSIQESHLIYVIIAGKLIWCIGMTTLLSKWSFSRKLFGYSR